MNIDDIEKSVRKSRRFLYMLFGVVMGSYLIWFFIVNDYNLSMKTSDWGSFGDFIGGLLNPLIAYLAFYWLTVSVLVQKIELQETKKALIDTSKSQEHQARISAIQAELSAVNVNLEAEYRYRDYILNNGYLAQGRQTKALMQSVLTRDGQLLNAEDALRDVNAQINQLLIKQKELLDKISGLNNQA